MSVRVHFGTPQDNFKRLIQELMERAIIAIAIAATAIAGMWITKNANCLWALIIILFLG